MLVSKGLELGQFATERRRRRAGTTIPKPSRRTSGPCSIGRSPISTSRCGPASAWSGSGISTIGELVRRTGDDLLECKNFGVTSLNEVREKLTLQSLKLRGD